MPFVHSRPGGSVTIHVGEKKYVLLPYVVPPPGTPQEVIDRARKIGLVVLDPGHPAPPLKQVTTIGGIKLRPSMPGKSKGKSNKTRKKTPVETERAESGPFDHLKKDEANEK